MIKMIAKSTFADDRIVGPEGSRSVEAGQPFEAPWHFARDIARRGLAEPEKGVDLDKEPSDPVEAHSSLSVGDHKAINERRKSGKGGGNEDRAKAASAALLRVQGARKALDEAEKAVKDKPSSAAREKLTEAQAEYDAAETEAKAFTGT